MSTELKALLDAMQARCDAATDGPWSATHGPHELPRIWSDAPHYEDAEFIAKCSMRDDLPDAEFIAAARQDLPRLIAAVEAVLTLAEAWRYKGEYGDGPWQLGEGPDESGQALDDASSQLRAAVRAALIGVGDE